MSKYIGITIGPILDILSSVTKPAGLWGGSFLFSYIAKNLCQKLYKDRDKTKEDTFISPFFETDENGKIKTIAKGIGLFHDRIIFKSEDNYLNKTITIINDLKSEVGQKLIRSLTQEKQKMKKRGKKFEDFNEQEVKEFVNNFLQIYAIEKEVDEGKNPILVLSPYLDALELQKSYNLKEKTNYFLKIFENDSIKECFLIDDFGEFKDSPIVDDININNIKKIDDIARGNNLNENMKKYSYYAIVNADGDNMGKILNSISDPKDIKDFSESCFKYAISATKKIKEFGATTIYAGGDDLLFISPLESVDKTTIFDLLLEIEICFKNEFEIEKYKKFKPSLSFGVSINYKKFPLYEAFENGVELLFGVAKQEKKKNTTAVKFQKHSGKSTSLIITGTKPEVEVLGDFKSENKVYELIRELLKQYNNDSDDFLKAVRLKLYEFKILFQKAILEENKENRRRLLENLFDNVFDHEPHKDEENKKYIEKIKELLIELSGDESIKIIEDHGIKEERVILIMDSVLRILKFFTEKGEEGK